MKREKSWKSVSRPPQDSNTFPLVWKNVTPNIPKWIFTLGIIHMKNWNPMGVLICCDKSANCKSCPNQAFFDTIEKDWNLMRFWHCPSYLDKQNFSIGLIIMIIVQSTKVNHVNNLGQEYVWFEFLINMGFKELFFKRRFCQLH